MAYTLNEMNRLGQLTTTLLPPTHLKSHTATCASCPMSKFVQQVTLLDESIGNFEWFFVEIQLVKFQVVSYTHWMLVAVNSAQISSKNLLPCSDHRFYEPGIEVATLDSGRLFFTCLSFVS